MTSLTRLVPTSTPPARQRYAALTRLITVAPICSTVMSPVCELLTKKWSPEQVAHELNVRFAGQPDWQLCAESIYQAIYDPATALTRPAKSSLRSRRRRRRLRTQGLRRRGRLPQMTMIAQRPSHVEGRQQAGHWEGDLIMGTGNGRDRDLGGASGAVRDAGAPAR